MVTLVRSWLVLALQLAASASAGPTVLLDCKGGGSVDCTAAFRKAAATVADAGGGTIQVPPGVFVTGGFNISSRTTLNIAPGGSITGKRSSDPFSFPAVAPLPSFGTGRDGEPARYHPIVWCINAHDVRITGGGTIDGSGDFWWHRDANALERPHLLELHNCTGVEVDHIVLKDSPFWTLHPVSTTLLAQGRECLRARSAGIPPRDGRLMFTRRLLTRDDRPNLNLALLRSVRSIRLRSTFTTLPSRPRSTRPTPMASTRTRAVTF